MSEEPRGEEPRGDGARNRKERGETHERNGPEIVLIAAVAEDSRVIGKDGSLPWHLPEDMRRFKRLTTGHAVLMGRKTFESVVRRLGHPLPNRRTVVLTSRGDIPEWPEVEACAGVDEALELLADEDLVYVTGGESVYRELLPKADRLELTLVEGEWEGDTFFPAWEHLEGDVFQVSAEEPRDGYRFVTLERAD